MSQESKYIYKNNVRLNNVQGVNRLLQRTINSLIRDEITENKARAIGYLSNILLKGLEIGELSERVEYLEDLVEREVG